MSFTFTTSVTAASLAPRYKREVGDPEVIRVYAQAVERLTEATVDAFRPIPEEVCDEMVIRVARALWDGARQQNGTAQATQLETGQTLARAPRDPLREVQPDLARYVIGFG